MSFDLAALFAECSKKVNNNNIVAIGSNSSTYLGREVSQDPKKTEKTEEIQEKTLDRDVKTPIAKEKRKYLEGKFLKEFEVSCDSRMQLLSLNNHPLASWGKSGQIAIASYRNVTIASAASTEKEVFDFNKQDTFQDLKWNPFNSTIAYGFDSGVVETWDMNNTSSHISRLEGEQGVSYASSVEWSQPQVLFIGYGGDFNSLSRHDLRSNGLSVIYTDETLSNSDIARTQVTQSKDEKFVALTHVLSRSEYRMKKFSLKSQILIFDTRRMDRPVDHYLSADPVKVQWDEVTNNLVLVHMGTDATTIEHRDLVTDKGVAKTVNSMFTDCHLFDDKMMALVKDNEDEGSAVCYDMHGLEPEELSIVAEAVISPEVKSLVLSPYNSRVATVKNNKVTIQNSYS